MCVKTEVCSTGVHIGTNESVPHTILSRYSHHMCVKMEVCTPVHIGTDKFVLYNTSHVYHAHYRIGITKVGIFEMMSINIFSW